MERLDLPVQFVDGLRVSDEATVEVAKMVLVGKVNKDIVLLLGRHGQPAVGLCGDDGLMFRAVRQLGPERRRHRLRRSHRPRRHRRAAPRRARITSRWSPASVPMPTGNSYNINADDGRGRDRPRARRLQGDVPDRRRRLAAGPRRPHRASSPRRPRPNCGARCRRSAVACGRSSRRAWRRSRAASRAQSSSMVGSRTRCCSNSSPTPVRAR